MTDVASPGNMIRFDPDPQTRRRKIHCKQELIVHSLQRFYAQRTDINEILPILLGTSALSLRLIDWFVTNFAKKNFTVYSIPAKNRCSTVYNGEENMERFKVFNSYKLELKAYSKIRFDPFSRRERIMIPYADDTFLETTIGQLNFFKWAIDNMVLEYIEENYDAIEADMNSRNSISKKNVEESGETTDNKTRKKREELSVSACKSIKKEVVKIVVKFN